jgi:hypothetical protein
MSLKNVVVAASVTVAAIVVIACSGGGQQPGDKFERDCKAKGGHVTTQKQGGSTSRVCLPPAGGWQ